MFKQDYPEQDFSTYEFRVKRNNDEVIVKSDDYDENIYSVASLFVDFLRGMSFTDTVISRVIKLDELEKD